MCSLALLRVKHMNEHFLECSFIRFWLWEAPGKAEAAILWLINVSDLLSRLESPRQQVHCDCSVSPWTCCWLLQGPWQGHVSNSKTEGLCSAGICTLRQRQWEWVGGSCLSPPGSAAPGASSTLSRIGLSTLLLSPKGLSSGLSSPAGDVKSRPSRMLS